MDLIHPDLDEGSGFPSCKIELRNPITQNDITRRITNSKFV